jgi:hypothetical protein
MPLHHESSASGIQAQRLFTHREVKNDDSVSEHIDLQEEASELQIFSNPLKSLEKTSDFGALPLACQKIDPIL